MSIVVENLSYIYMKGSPFEKVALDQVNLTIRPGEFVGVIGHTGSGKSTLVQHFNALLKPTSGKVRINDIDISGKNLKELRKQIGMVFQYPEHQLFEETVARDVAFGLQKLGLGEAEIGVRVSHALELVGLSPEVMEKSPFELSGGQKRRVAIAGVIAMEPEILVLDEPTAGLDPAGRDELFGLIRKLHQSRGITVILVSHSMEDVARITKRVIVMNRGRIEMDGSTEEVFRKAEALERIGLSVPQITYLMKRLRADFPQLRDGIFTVEDACREILKLLDGVDRHD